MADDDTTPPVVTNCPDAIFIPVAVGTASEVVLWIEPTATDNSGATPTVTQSHQPGDSFLVGTTRVAYTFTDMTGNEATCIFFVTIGKL